MLDYYSSQFPEVAAVHERLTGQVLDQVPGRYSPILFDRKHVNFDSDLTEEMLTRQWARVRHQVERGFTIRRKGGAHVLKLDALGNFMQNVSRFEHYKAFAEPVRDINGILNNKEWTDAISSLDNGEKVLKQLKTWFNQVAETGPPTELSDFSGKLNWLRQNAAVSMIGLNALSGMRAGISMMHSIGYGGDADNLKYHLDVAAAMSEDPAAVWREARRILPELELRFAQGIEREFREIAQRQQMYGRMGGRLTHAKRLLSGVALYHYKMADGVTVSIATVAHYNKMIGRGASHEEARDYARRMIESTQPMGDEKDLPGLWRGSDTAKLLSTFQNMINQEYNIIFRDLPAIWKRRDPGIKGVAKSSKQMLWLLAWSKLIPGWLLSVISRGRTPTAEELGKDTLMYAILPIWPVGSMYAAAVQGYEKMSVPTGAFLDDALKAAQSKKLSKKLRYGAQSAGRLVGVPVNQPVRTLLGTIDLSRGDTDDFRRLLWSEWSLEEPEEPLRLR